MKILSASLAAHLAGEVTTLATCWKITRRDATVLGFTDHDRDLVISGVTYKASAGFTPSAIASTSDLSVDNLDVEGMLDSASITQEDIFSGLFDYAQIDIFMVNYSDLSQGILTLRRGWLGEITLRNHQFIAEIRGLTQQLSHHLGEFYSPACRAQLGDTRCKVNMAGHSHTGTITAVTSNQVFADSSRMEAAGIFTFGVITFISGPNTGRKMEIKEFSQGTFVLAMPLPYAVNVGNSYNVTKGCDKTLTTCQSRFNNVLNFRGEPHVPGMDRILETAGTRSNW